MRKQNHKRMRACAIALPVVLAGLSANLHAQQVSSVLQAETRTVRIAQESQERIDKVVQETRSLTDQYKGINKEIEGLNVYNQLLERQISGQTTELNETTRSIEQVTVIERQILPLMVRMIQGLQQFVSLDVPFLIDERTKRVEGLQSLIERSDVTPAEKFRRVMEAYQIENDYGRTIESYKGAVDINGESRAVDFLRVGRIALLYQTEDAEETGAWDQAQRQWVDLGSDYRNQVKTGLAIAQKQRAPDLLMLPISAPEKVNE
jgi:DNA repair exonuclease SbcCD ATPase subunit